jgi:hypothetical protein
MKRVLHILIFGLVSVMPFFLFGRMQELGNAQTFWSYVNQKQVVVAQLHTFSRRDRSSSADYTQLKNRFQAVSKNYRFNYAEVAFVMVNADQCPSILDKLGFNCLPAVVIFIDGRPVDGHLCGIRSEVEINDYIERTLSDTLQNRICQRKEHDEKVEEAKLAAWAYWGPWWYGGFYGPRYSYGFGWGFSGRCGDPFLGGWNCAGNPSCYCAGYR